MSWFTKYMMENDFCPIFVKPIGYWFDSENAIGYSIDEPVAPGTVWSITPSTGLTFTISAAGTNAPSWANWQWVITGFDDSTYTVDWGTEEVWEGKLLESVTAVIETIGLLADNDQFHARFYIIAGNTLTVTRSDGGDIEIFYDDEYEGLQYCGLNMQDFAYGQSHQITIQNSAYIVDWRAAVYDEYLRWRSNTSYYPNLRFLRVGQLGWSQNSPLEWTGALGALTKVHRFVYQWYELVTWWSPSEVAAAVPAMKGLCDLSISVDRADAPQMTADDVNAILAAMWENRDEPKETATRSIVMTGSKVAAPTGQGLTDKAALQAYRSPNDDPGNALWTVTTN